MFTHRQNFILEKLKKAEFITISSLAEQLAVSKMTVHRDLDELEQAGLILKQHGKVLATSKLKGNDPSICLMCNRKVKERNAFTLITNDGNKLYLCCPHCGLIAYSHREDVWQMLVTDFLHGHVMTASDAYYLIGHELTICCSPSVLAFASEKEAFNFQKGFGGRVVDVHAAIAYLTHSQRNHEFC